MTSPNPYGHLSRKKSKREASNTPLAEKSKTLSEIETRRNDK